MVVKRSMFADYVREGDKAAKLEKKKKRKGFRTPKQHKKKSIRFFNPYHDLFKYNNKYTRTYSIVGNTKLFLNKFHSQTLKSISYQIKLKNKAKNSNNNTNTNNNSNNNSNNNKTKNKKSNKKTNNKTNSKNHSKTNSKSNKINNNNNKNQKQ